MPRFIKPAIKVEQGNLVLYATTFTIKDLMNENFYKINMLDPEGCNDGYQRILDKRRTKRIANYFNKAWNGGDALLPTSILLATKEKIEYNKNKHTITFDLNKVAPFNVVDGQHRIEGLIAAAKNNKEILSFEIATNIAINIDEVTQMCHFLIVNTTQKSIDKAVEQQIYSRLTSMVNFEDIPTLPRWIQNQVNKGEDQEALIIVEYLNRDKSSPWYKKIAMANQSKDLEQVTIRQNSFVHSIKKYILSSNNPLMHTEDFIMRNKILLNYWSAIKNILTPVDDKSSLVFKSNGLNLFNMISPTIFSQMFNKRDFRIENIERMLRDSFAKLSDEFSAISSPEWWKKGSGASSLNSVAIRKYASALNQSIISLDKIDATIVL
jgi:DGQHR domain-containing protein